MPEGFEVDLEALGGAAKGIAEIMREMAERDLDDLDGSAQRYGHENLHEAFEHFCGRSSASWFEQPGGGIQYKFDRPLKWYEENGYLRRLP